MTRKLLKWMGIALLSPILLFFMLAALLYCPPIQNWAVRQVADIASEQTGMHITVGHVNLEWPLNLGIDRFRIISPAKSLPSFPSSKAQPDTIADIGHLVADVQLCPLFRKHVVINALEVSQASINTNGFISDLCVKGKFEHLFVKSRGIDLDRQTVEVNGTRLENARLDIVLSDTAAVDTTESKTLWIINADSVEILRTAVHLHLPGDTFNIKAYMGRTVARQADINLAEKTYQVGSFDWFDGQLAYANRLEPATSGLDVNHIDLTDIRLCVDSIYYGPQGTSLFVRQTAVKEKSGLEITHLSGKLQLDTAFTHLSLPHFLLRTPDSDIEAVADIDFNVMDSVSPGKLFMRLNAQLGKQDLLRFAGGMPQDFISRYPNHPLSIKGSVNGNMERMEISGLDISLPSAMHLKADGFAANLRYTDRIRGQMALEAETHSLDFLSSLLPSTGMRLPPMTLRGNLTASGQNYMTDLVLHEGQGTVKATVKASLVRQRPNGAFNLGGYDADIDISQMDLRHFLPKDSLGLLSVAVKARGCGTDYLNPQSRLDADINVGLLQYGHLNLQDIIVCATLKDGHANATIEGHNELFSGRVGVDALLSTKRIEATIAPELKKADLFRMRLTNKPITIGTSGSLTVFSDLGKTHELKGRLSQLHVTGSGATYQPEDIGLLLRTNPDTTLVRIQSGDFIVKLDTPGYYERLIDNLSVLADSAMSQFEQKIIDQPAIKRLLPTVKLHIESKQKNPIANILRTMDISFRELFLDLDMSPVSGINATSYVFSLNYDSTLIDTVKLSLRQKGEKLTYQGQVRNNRKNPQFVFNALFDGHVHEHGALVGLRYFDNRDRMGIRLGVTAEMEHDGLRFRLMPAHPTIGYKEFNLNEDNYIFLANDRRITADIGLVADDKTGVKIYSNNDSPMVDLTVSLNRFNLDEFTSVIPYMPRMSGLLGGDFHIVQDQSDHFSIASDLSVQNMAYEGSPIGNISSELTYLQLENNTHAMGARLMLNDKEFGLLEGTYTVINGESPKSKASNLIDATFTMTRFPLSIVNGFVPDQLIGLDGYGEGSIAIKGSTAKPVVDGEIYLDSAYLVSIPYGVRLRFDNDPVRIVGSHLLLENFGLYAYNDTPLDLMGDIDFSETDNLKMNMRMRARNYQVINAKQTQKSIVFGKAFVNIFARLNGPLDKLSMRGRLDVLSSTDLTYMLLDSPLSTDNRLDELVKFTDFNDTTQTIVTRPTPSGLSVDMNIDVSQAAHIVCDLNAEQTNYVDLTGGGSLRMRYNHDGISLTGRYTLASGEMKYSLPVIPLKTFNIQEGSYVEFTGDPSNPRLNITATERTKANVGSQNGGTRSVMFDCGVVITKTLNDMGLEFIISAPEDMNVNNELQSMSVEERGKVAVTMLTTGMYLADGNTGGFTMNSALSSFLQSEINNIAGSALKTLDLQVGLENSTDASGTTRTDYSFKFAKRFFNNRLKLQIGGKVSTGKDDISGQQKSFFDNVSMEYRLNQEGTQNLKLFYMQNVYDWLDGYTGQYGGGFLWRRKVNSLWDILQFWKKEQIPMMRQSQTMPGRTAVSSAITPSVPADTIAKDSMKHETP